MSEKYYISKIVEWEDPETPNGKRLGTMVEYALRQQSTLEGVRWYQKINKPSKDWGFIQVECPDHSVFEGNKGIWLLSDDKIHKKLSKSAKDKVKEITSINVDDCETMGEVVKKIRDNVSVK